MTVPTDRIRAKKTSFTPTTSLLDCPIGWPKVTLWLLLETRLYSGFQSR